MDLTTEDALCTTVSSGTCTVILITKRELVTLWSLP